MPAGHRAATALLFLSVAGFTGPEHASASLSQEELSRAGTAFYKSLRIDAAKAYTVQNVTITKDIATFTLESGTLYATEPVEGIVGAAVFIGKGRAGIAPSRPMDRLCLELASGHYLKQKLPGKVDAEFGEALLIAFDDTLDAMIPKLAAASSSDAARAAGILKDRLGPPYWLEEPLDFSLLQKKLGRPDNLVYLDFRTSWGEWLAFTFAPQKLQEVALETREIIGSTIARRALLKTHLREEFDEGGNYLSDPVKDQKPWIDPTAYKAEITIPDTEHFTVEVDVTFTAVADNLPLVFFDLRNNIPPPGTIIRSTDTGLPITITKLTDGSGATLPHVHAMHRVWIAPPEPLKAGESYTYHFSLDEATIIQLSSVHYEVLNTYAWFPQYGFDGSHYSMDWTIKAKKPLYAMGSGRIVKEGTEGIYNVTQLVTDKQVRFPSLLFGQYKKETDVYKASEAAPGVELAVFYSPRATFTITDPDVIAGLTPGRSTPISYDLTVPPGKPKSVLEETKGLLKFMESLYGAFPYGSLNIAEMSPFLAFGQAPPALIQLTGEAFMNPTAEIQVGNALVNFFEYRKADYFHEFFSHEMAHQWFGHTVVRGTEEDTWLSESFAEYSAGLYIMQYSGQNRFQGKLKEWRDGARIGDLYAPIAWAERLSGQIPGPRRSDLLYSKGPYVVHMLRMQIGHDNFVKAMKNAMTKYRHRPTSTDQLRQEVEAVVGYKMDFFFNQWYRDTGIPTFDYTTDVRQADDGKWVATVKISQRDKNKLKIVSMPVFFHFGKDKVIVKERPILKAEDVYQVKLPEKPQKITLDDYKTLLAEIVSQDPSGL
ncbi:MAG TPA: M1 family aminopeptidase [Candidatus Polarisedimenticolia bacterium]|nr:M1 family aminopeptidase [Candidatus Polarisedimenticolia bacterium]